MSRDETLTVVSPLSLKTWYQAFAGSQSEVLFIGEDPSTPGELAELVLAHHGSSQVRILSGHDSLLRDWLLAKELAARDISVYAQSGMAVASGVDKILQKHLLAIAGIPTPEWGLSGASLPQSDRVLWKERSATQSRGLVWHGDAEGAATNRYWEAFVYGIEYSVVLYRDDRGTAVFPLVWKGKVQEDLTPPWLRLRLVPVEGVAGATVAMIDTAVQVADMLDAWGYVEVEFILPESGPALVIDINPRISGTMRIAAMAADLPIFDPAAFRGTGTRVLPCVRFAAEVPYQGEPFTTANAVASSRLTCSASSAQEALEALGARGFVARESYLPLEWRED